MKKTLIIIGSLIGVLILVFVVVPIVAVTYTTAPLHAAAWLLKKQNIEMSDFSGNLMNGVTIGNIKSTEADHEFEMHQMKLTYSSLIDYVKTKNLVVDEMSVDGFVFKENKTDGKTEKKPVTPTKEEQDFKAAMASSMQSMVIKKISFKNGVFKRADGTEVKLTELSVDNFTTNKTGDVSLGAARFNSSNFDVKVPPTTLSSALALKIGGNVEVTVKPQMSKKLKQEIHFSFHDLVVNVKTNEFSGSIDGLDGKFKFELTSKGAMVLNIQNLDLSSYFNLKTDVQSVDLQIAVPDMPSVMTGNYPVMGSVTAFGEKFPLAKTSEKSMIPNILAVQEHNQVQMGFSFTQFVMQTVGAFAAPGDVAVPVQMMVQSTNPRVATDNDKLAYFTFEKPFNRLKAPEKTKVTELIQQFHIGAVAQVAAAQPVAAQATQAVAAPATTQRVPANAVPAQAPQHK